MLEGVSRVLILRPDGIGDLLNSTPAISALRQAYPQAKISVLVKAHGAEILYHNPDVDEVIICEPNGVHKGLIGKLRLARQLRQGKYDLAIVLRTSSLCNFLAWALGAKYRAGRYQKRFKSQLTHTTKIIHPKGSVHEINRNFDILHAIGVKEVTEKMTLKLLDEEIDWARGKVGAQPAAPLQKEQKDEKDFIVGIHPGGSTFDKVWTAEGYAQVGDKIVDEFRRGAACHINNVRATHASPLLFCAPGDEPFCEKIEALMKYKPKRIEKVSVRQMAALIHECDIFICNDSGPMHIAAALNVPLVAIFGPTDHVRWAPKNDNALIAKAEGKRRKAEKIKKIICRGEPLCSPNGEERRTKRIVGALLAAPNSERRRAKKDVQNISMEELPFEMVWEKVVELMKKLSAVSYQQSAISFYRNKTGKGTENKTENKTGKEIKR